MHLRENFESLKALPEEVFVELDERVHAGAFMLACDMNPEFSTREIYSMPGLDKTLYSTKCEKVFDKRVKVGLCTFESFKVDIPFPFVNEDENDTLTDERSAKMRTLVSGCVWKIRYDSNAAKR